MLKILSGFLTCEKYILWFGDFLLLGAFFLKEEGECFWLLQFPNFSIKSNS